uniref:Uncharacterized protein n=1 Tax=Sinocyclocheilus rhinocerous TaxID=307959 RepID=A0A673FY67_9TELE
MPTKSTLCLPFCLLRVCVFGTDLHLAQLQEIEVTLLPQTAPRIHHIFPHGTDLMLYGSEMSCSRSLCFTSSWRGLQCCLGGKFYGTVQYQFFLHMFCHNKQLLKKWLSRLMIQSSCKYLSSESLQEEKSWPVEKENSTLQHTLHNLEVQLAAERARRVEAEHETELTAQENSALEERLSLLKGARRRQAELEAKVEELWQLWRSESSAASLTDTLLPDSVFFAVGAGHEEEGADSLSHKAVQTPTAPAQRRKSQATTTTDTICLADELHQPEYKAVFKKIFTCIQKTENRAGLSQ